MKAFTTKLGVLIIGFSLAFSLQSCGKKAAKMEEAVGEGVEANADTDKIQEETHMSVAEINANISDVYFEFDKAQLTDAGRNAIAKNFSVLQMGKGVSVLIEGHCDERGTTEYNLALGQKRAEVVKDVLISMGFPAEAVSTVSYGKEKPQCNAANESCYQLNRRAHFDVR
ncbi:MAG: OmpA family protein [Nitrospinae bacterium]|nr:OmpA family protein [Nitrospinota bacterium]